MSADAIVAVQIAKLFQQRTQRILDLIEPQGAPRRGDIPIVDEWGAVIAYARPCQKKP